MNQLDEWQTKYDLKTVESRNGLRTELERLGFFEGVGKPFVSLDFEKEELPFEQAVRFREALDNFIEDKNAKKSTP